MHAFCGGDLVGSYKILESQHPDLFRMQVRWSCDVLRERFRLKASRFGAVLDIETATEAGHINNEGGKKRRRAQNGAATP